MSQPEEPAALQRFPPLDARPGKRTKIKCPWKISAIKFIIDLLRARQSLYYTRGARSRPLERRIIDTRRVLFKRNNGQLQISRFILPFTSLQKFRKVRYQL